jgi:hypothetical protein
VGLSVVGVVQPIAIMAIIKNKQSQQLKIVSRRSVFIHERLELAVGAGTGTIDEAARASSALFLAAAVASLALT